MWRDRSKVRIRRRPGFRRWAKVGRATAELPFPRNAGIGIGADYRWSIFDFLTALRGIARTLSRVPRTLSPMLIKHRLSSLAIASFSKKYIYIYIKIYLSFFLSISWKTRDVETNLRRNDLECSLFFFSSSSFSFNSIYSVKIANREVERELVISFGEVVFVQTREGSLKVIGFIKRAHNVHFL